MSKIVVIPDTQVRPGDDLKFLNKLGHYLVDKKPDVVVHLGDHWDMPSLSSYDVGTKSFEGRRYKADIQAGNKGMVELIAPIAEYNDRQRKNGKKQYKPRMVFLCGNHEQRIERAVNSDPKLDGTIGYQDLHLDDWEVHPFLEVVVIDGVAFSHYFTSGVLGRPASSAAALLSKKHMSAVMGHVQQRQIAYATAADGRQMTAIFAGCFNEHEEDYLGPQGNTYWRGFWVLHEVSNGAFDEMPVSLNFLNSKYASGE